MLVASSEVSIPPLNTEQRVSRVVDEIRSTALREGRDPTQVKILPISKQKTVADIRTLVSHNFREFGESYVTEAIPKIETLATEKCIWHYVGVVQSNKTKRLARHFDWVQSVDRVHIGKRLADARDDFSETPLNICVQVNIDEEPTKAGVSMAEVPELVEALHDFSQLRVRGLMAIPNPKASRDATRSSFRSMWALFEELRPQTSPYWDTLSMGMSADFDIAIEEGTTMVRIGTALFGPRI